MGLSSVDVTVYVDEDAATLRNTAPPTSSPNLVTLKLNNLILTNPKSITTLELTKCDISRIPNSIQNLNLKQLILSHNKFTEVPSCLYSGLAHLELLDLSFNALRDFDVEPACSCTIQILNLSNNQIRDFPHWILTLRCPNLREVYYNHNCLVKLKTDRDFSFTKLEFRNSHLLDEDFGFFKKIKTLELLDISNDANDRNENFFKDMNQLFERHKWRNLRILKLNHLILSIIPKDLFWVKTLIELHLVNCDLNWIPEEIKYLENLQVLIVCHNSICRIPNELYTSEKLTTLRASFNAIYKIEQFTNSLDILDLYSNEIEICNCDLREMRFVDLELNFLGELSQDYSLKRDQYRAKFDLKRLNGSKEKISTFEENEADSTSSEVYSEENNSYITTNAGEEFWDYDDSQSKTCVRNPEITSSDDDWDGREDLSEEKNLKQVEFDADEDWIFTDAEE